MRVPACLCGALILLFFTSYGQSDSLTNTLSHIQGRSITKIGNQASQLDNQVAKNSEAYLTRFKAEQDRLQRLLQSANPSAALATGNNTDIYNKLLANLHSTTPPSTQQVLKEYIPGLDSVQTALKYLSNSGTNVTGAMSGKIGAISNANSQLSALEGRLQAAGDIEKYMQNAQTQLTQQFTQLGLVNELSNLNKEAFYYQQQLVEYKNLLRDPSKAGEQVLTTLDKVPAFSQFLKKNSYLGQLFGLPDNYGDQASIEGLQTRDKVEKALGQTIGTKSGGGGVDPSQMVDQKIQAAHEALNQLKQKLGSLGNSGGSGDMIMPGFRYNDQKTKSLKKRLEYGFNVQTQQSSSFLPASCNMTGLLGYKITSKTIVGAGVGYTLGLGSGLNHIRFSNQGVNFRTYIDVQAKGSLWISGGLEYNYMQEFKNLRSISNLDIWQKSALVGLTKKTRISKNTQTNIQLLFDALYKEHIPQSSPVVFRIGYKF